MDSALMRSSEKLTEVVTVRLGSDLASSMARIASMNSMDTGEYLRSLIEKDIEHHREMFESLSTIFGDK